MAHAPRCLALGVPFLPSDYRQRMDVLWRPHVTLFGGKLASSCRPSLPAVPAACCAPTNKTRAVTRMAGATSGAQEEERKEDLLPLNICTGTHRKDACCGDLNTTFAVSLPCTASIVHATPSGRRHLPPTTYLTTLRALHLAAASCTLTSKQAAFSCSMPRCMPVTPPACTTHATLAFLSPPPTCQEEAGHLPANKRIPAALRY